MKAKLFYPSPRVPRPTGTRAPRLLLPALLITIAFMLVGSSVDAHGTGYYEIRGANVAPYVVHVWVAPGLLRTGNVHIDTAVFDQEKKPAQGVLVQVAFVPLESEALPLVSLAGAPDPKYPHARGASLRLETPGMYRLEITVSDPHGAAGTTSADVYVTTVSGLAKAGILAVLMMSASTALWLLYQTRAFWVERAASRQAKLRHLPVRRRVGSMESRSFVKGGISFMNRGEVSTYQSRRASLAQRLNGVWHAPALWIYMLIVVSHWMEHVLQIYQIYGLGWEPDKAGGILGVIYPGLIESETLHFVYDFIQWAGILVLLPGFRDQPARKFWFTALVFQTWHYIEHVLLMGQYLSGYYLFGAPHQISILQLWFPRAELHFAYNLLVFIPMVIAVHFYLQPKVALLAAMKHEPATESEAH